MHRLRIKYILDATDAIKKYKKGVRTQGRKKHKSHQQKPTAKTCMHMDFEYFKSKWYKSVQERERSFVRKFVETVRCEVVCDRVVR